MAGVTGLEPATSGLTGRRSNQTELHPRVGHVHNRGQQTGLYRPRAAMSSEQVPPRALLGVTREKGYVHNNGEPRHDFDPGGHHMPAVTPTQERAHALLDRIDALVTARDRAGAIGAVADAARSRDLSIPQLYVLVLAPLMRLTGARWQSGGESIWEEHYTTGVVRTIVESLAPAVIEQSAAVPRAGRTVVIGCPEEEYHDLGPRMLFDRFLLAGYDAHFLGANVPEPEIVAAATALDADTVVLSASTHFHRVRLREYADALEAARPGVTVWVGGPAFACGASDWPPDEVLDASAFLNDLDGAPDAECE